MGPQGPKYFLGVGISATRALGGGMSKHGTFSDMGHGRQASGAHPTGMLSCFH